jgi:drug/metabolite transporter (DMT)-like permease
VAFGISAVIEQWTARRVRRRPVLAPRLLLDLARRRVWLLGIVATLAGVSLQAVALSLGPLALVQPILGCDLIFAVLTSAIVVRHRPPDRVMLAGVIACAGGAAGFLTVARPSGGRLAVGLLAVVPLAAALAAAMAGCLLLARYSRRARPLALALACGIDYGVTAFLFKLVSSELAGGPAQVFGHWPIWALTVIGPVGFLLNQNAFQQGTLIAPVLAVITSADPLASICIAHFWLGEQIAGGPADMAAEAASLLVMIAGITALAHRAPSAGQTAAGSPPPRTSGFPRADQVSGGGPAR